MTRTSNSNSPNYWESCYNQDGFRYDSEKVIPSVIHLFSQPFIDKSVNILLPGAGHAYEAEYLYQQGFKNLYVLDFAKTPLAQFKQRVPSFPKSQVIEADFFNFSEIKQFKNFFDYLIEKAFFCAITPDLRQGYVESMHKLLKKNGVLCGVFINGESAKSIEHPNHPPYGCQVDEYKRLFTDKFTITMMKAGKGSNLLIKMLAK